MTASKSPRAKALAGLKLLMGARAAPAHLIGELFPFEIIPPGIAAGKPTTRTYDDRAIAIMTTTVVEQALESALLTRFVALSSDDERALLSEDGAPLSNLDSKVKIGFALGLFGRLAKDDLFLMCKVRNVFAHSRLTINFDTPEVAVACALLRAPPHLIKDNARERFILSGFQFTAQFLTVDSRVDGEAEERRRAVLDLPEPPP